MPEGHTLHRVAQDHRRLFVGQRLEVSSPQGRFAEGAETLSGRRLEGVEAVGKHLFYRWSPRGRSRRIDTLHIHLGLYGKFRLHRRKDDAPWPEPRGAVRLRVVGELAAFDLNGPTRCELLDAAGYEERVARLGPDPLRADADPERAWRRIARSKSPVGLLLMNQEVIAGVGNIYRCEALHRRRIHPDRPGKELRREEFEALWADLVELMKIGVKHNRIIVADPAVVGKSYGRMNREERLRVYKKPHCPDCYGPVTESLMAGRKVFACNACQS